MTHRHIYPHKHRERQSRRSYIEWWNFTFWIHCMTNRIPWSLITLPSWHRGESAHRCSATWSKIKQIKLSWIIQRWRCFETHIDNSLILSYSLMFGCGKRSSLFFCSGTLNPEYKIAQQQNGPTVQLLWSKQATKLKYYLISFEA